jgi:tetratricopeptide (TPR) repeat protein
MNILKPLEENAIIPLADLENDWYIQILKKKYPHLVVNSIQWKEYQTSKAFFRFNDIVKDNINNYPIYMDQSLEVLEKNRYFWVGEGIFAMILEKNMNKDTIYEILERNKSGFIYWDNDRIFKDTNAVRILENYAKFYNNRGYKYSEVNKYNKAIIEFKKALNIKPDSLITLYNLANMYTNIRRYEIGIKIINKILDIDSEYIEARILLGKILEKCGNLDSSIKEFKTVIKMSHYSSSISEEKLICIHEILFRLYVMKGMINEAIAQCKSIIKLKPNHIRAYKNLGILYYKKKLFKKAKQQFNYILQIDHNNSYALRMIKRIESM